MQAQVAQPIVLNYETIVAEVTMYTSDPAETDDTPFITANGEEVKQGTIACPQRYKFGTKVIIRNVEYTLQI